MRRSNVVWRADRMLIILQEYCEKYSLGEALDSPADIEFSDQIVLQPDVFVVPEVRPSWRDVKTLTLAVEVVSPSTARPDRHDKQRIYRRERVPEYWIVDLDARIVELWRPDDSRPEVLSEQLEWQPSSAHPALTIDLPGVFSPSLRLIGDTWSATHPGVSGRGKMEEVALQAIRRLLGDR